jgi:peptidoglycan/LPS O-acetylase OafA/YrhL
MGGGIITLALIAVRAVQYLDLSRYGEPMSDASPDLFVGLLAGIAAAAFFAWRRSGPLENTWQRGVIGVLAPVGALIIAFILAVPAEYFFGMAGLIVLALASFGLAGAAGRWASRGEGREKEEAGRVTS